MIRSFVSSFVLMLTVLAVAHAKRPCNRRCNAPECMCVRRNPVELSECICAGEKSLGEECVDELQCSDGNKCVDSVCTEVPRGPPQKHRWFYEETQ
ncbi:hypothetical protein AAVH_30182 [Aphelenchoides avenae]|nr:hypothetical protein AAVH_30182 [Aphelenchus avenae]